MRRFTCGILLGFALTISACTSVPEATFATRNAQVDFDLHSVVRTQSNDLLALTQKLEARATAGFLSHRKLDRELESSIAQMDQIHMNLPSLLADQDVEIAQMRQDVSKGHATQDDLKSRTKAIGAYRNALLASLDASKSRALYTFEALNNAQVTGQNSLSDHARKAGFLARDLEAAHTMIAMQM